MRAPTTPGGTSWRHALRMLDREGKQDVHAAFAALEEAKHHLRAEAEATTTDPRVKAVALKQLRAIDRELDRLAAFFKDDPYTALVVVPSASDKAVKKAYRDLARKYHPDKLPASSNLFVLLKSCYDVLRDPARRQKVDAARRA